MSTTTRRAALGLALAVLVVLAGCAGMGGDSAEHSTNLVNGDGAAEERTVAEEDASGEFQGQALNVQQRQLIRTAEIRVEVDSYEESANALGEAARSVDGFVSDSEQRVHERGDDRNWTSGRIVFRVPQGEFDAFVERVKREGSVESVSTNTEDVTDQIVDLEARLANLRAERDRLRSLYEDANETEDVLAVEERLSEVQSEIERLEARQQSLQEQVAYSTVTVELSEPVPDTAPFESQAWYDTGVLAAFLESVNGVVVVLRAAVVGAAYAAPYVVVFGTPVALGYALVQRRQNTRRGR